jgi:pyruvate dehydrogenase E1 component alpha subunit
MGRHSYPQAGLRLTQPEEDNSGYTPQGMASLGPACGYYAQQPETCPKNTNLTTAQLADFIITLFPFNNGIMAKETMAPEKKSKTTFTKETYLKWYEDMLLWRKIEEKAGHLYIQQKIRGFCHLYVGQEAVVAGSASAIRPDDNMITGYRNHVHPLSKGMHPKYMMAELYGKVTGCSKGNGGSMHMFSKELRFFGGHGIVGGQIPLGAGLAFADKFAGNDRVTLCYMGDGAVRQGALHEAFNLAMLWKLPVVFIIENNMYAMGTSVERSSNVHELYKLGLSYDMPSYQVDGMKPETMHEGVAEAVARARKGDGPTLLEVKTYRYKGHSMSDPQKYRTKEEVEEYKEEDPILWTLNMIQKNKWATEKEIEAIEERVNTLVEESVQFAEESPYPDASELYEDVYAEKNYPFIKEE